MTVQPAQSDLGSPDDGLPTHLTWEEVRNEFLGFYGMPGRPKSTLFSVRRALDIAEELVANPLPTDRGLDVGPAGGNFEAALKLAAVPWAIPTTPECRAARSARVGLRRAFASARISDQELTEAIVFLLAPEPLDFSPGLVTRYCSRPVTRDGKPISLATIKGQFSYFKLFCQYALKRHFLGEDPTAIRPVWLPNDVASGSEVGSAKFKHYSRVEVVAMLALADQEAAQGSWKAGRMQTLIYLLAFLGLRKAEALGLKCEDIDLREGSVVVRKNSRRRVKTKGSEAYLPICKQLKKILRLWLSRCGGVFVIPCEDVEKPWLTGGPSSRPLDQIRAFGQRAGVKRVNFKKWRATFATHAESLWGFSDGEIQRILRHTTPLTAKQHYRFGDLANLRDPMDRVSFDPRKGRTRALR